MAAPSPYRAFYTRRPPPPLPHLPTCPCPVRRYGQVLDRKRQQGLLAKAARRIKNMTAASAFGKWAEVVAEKKEKDKAKNRALR